MNKPFQVKSFVLNSGERVSIIIDRKTAIPLDLANQYLLQNRRPLHSPNTLRKDAATLCLVLNTFYPKQFDLDFIKSLSITEIFKLWEKLRSSNAIGLVSPLSHAHRWITFEKFFDYSINSHLLEIDPASKDFHYLLKKKEIILKEIKRLSFKPKTPRRRGIDKSLINQIISITRAQSILNPWIKRDRLRNQLIVDLLINLGIRAGELLKIEQADLKLNGSNACLVIKRSENDVEDPRKYEPRVKTFGRILEISPHLTDQIIQFLKERRTIPNSKKSKFLFIANTDGTPLSYAGLNALIKKIRLENPEDSRSITAHTFRRTWNDIFRENAEESGLQEELITQTQNYLQGRMANSQEAYKYASKHIEKTARIAHLNYQKNLLDGIK